MDKNKGKIKFYYIIITILILISLGIIIFFILHDQEKITIEQEINKELIEELNNKEKEFSTIKNSNTYLEERINKLNNIDQMTKDTKEEVFALAKELEQQIKNGNNKYKIAYLTFDDGPYYLTDKYLEVLKKYNVKATFFTIGAGKERCYDNYSVSCMNTYKKIVDGGHTIANHTYSHAIFYGLYSSTNSFMTQVQKQEDLIKKQTGVTTNIIRFPGGSSTAGRLKNSIITELRKKNYGWVDWTAQDGDGGDLSSTTQAWNNFTRSINDNIEVVLFHDYSSITLSILPKAIEYLQSKNYILLPLFYDSVMINK